MAFPAMASADVQAIDFDSAPPSLGSPVERVGDISFPLGRGFRPYRRDVGARAHSGTTVADLGECSLETEILGGSAGDCEFFQATTTAVLARTAKTVTLFAGRFGPVGPFDAPEQATLIAFDALGNRVASSGRQAITAEGFNTRLSVTRAAGDIASFRVFATGGVDGGNDFVGDLGIDDLSVAFADGGDPDFSLSTTSQILSLVQGQQVAVPVQINRINGSSGDVDLTVSGLPEGIRADPVTIPSGSSEVTLTLSAAANAPSTNFVSVPATITADPRGDANIAPGPRTTTLNVRVTRDYELRSGLLSEDDLSNGNLFSAEAADCAPADMPVTVRRDIAFDRSVVLSLRDLRDGAAGMPEGVSAEILPSPVVPPGGALAAERTIRFRMGPGSGGRSFLVLEARIAGDPTSAPHRFPIELSRTQPSATIGTSTPGSGLGRTPRFGGRGTTVQIHGTGFCPGTSVIVGNSFAEVPTRLVDDRTVEFEVPRNATTGKPVIVPPGDLSRYRVNDELTVDSFRNVNGFQFVNYKLGQISLGEFVRAYGADDLFIKVNPCWPWGRCDVVTGLLNPIAALDWGVMNATVPAINRFARSGHCFGMSLAVRQFMSREVSLGEFQVPGRSQAARMVHELGTEAGPGGELGSFLDAEQMKQFSSEGLEAYFNRPKSIQTQLETIEEEFRHNRPVLVSVNVNEPFRAHVVLAYDIRREGDSVDLFIYENNRPFTQDEENQPEGHMENVGKSVIHIDLEQGTWAMPWGDDFRTGGRGTLWAMRKQDIPVDPSIPGIGTLKDALAWLIFGSSDGAVATVATDTFMPLFGGGSAPGASAAGGTWIGRAGHPLDVKFIGKKEGSYDQTYVAPGFVAGAQNVVTEEGVRDEISGAGHTITFESGADRPLRLDLATDDDGAPASAATVSSHVSAGGADRAGLAGDGDLTYAHDGAPTSLRFTLTTVRRNGGPATFVSPPVAIRDGDRLRAVPLDRGGERVRLKIRNHGYTWTRVLHTRAKARGRVVLGAARLSGRRLSVRVKVSGLGRRALGGVALRLMRGKHVIARKAVALKRAGGAHRISWRLPRSVRNGRYRVVADARVLTGPAPGVTVSGSATARRASAIRLR